MSLRVSRFGQTGRRTRVPQIDSARDIGGRLFDAVFAGAVRDCYRGSLAQASGQGLRLRLRLTDVPEIAAWPWEFLFDSSQNRFVALSVETPVVRFLRFRRAGGDAGGGGATAPCRWSFRFLTDHTRLDVERECGKMETAVAGLKKEGRLSVDRIDVATLGELQRALSKQTYHILHFIGHGGANGAKKATWSSRTTTSAATPSTAPRSARCCTTIRQCASRCSMPAKGARTLGADAFAGVAQRLVQQGIPCVVAMQFEISDAAAIQFSSAFYAAVAAWPASRSRPSRRGDWRSTPR